MKGPNARLLLTCGNGCLAQPHRGLKAMDHIFKNKNHCVFQINCISLPHRLCGELLKLTNLNVTSLLSPPSALSQLLRSKERKYRGGGDVFHVWSTCCFSKTYPHPPPSIREAAIKGLSKIPLQESRTGPPSPGTKVSRLTAPASDQDPGCPPDVAGLHEPNLLTSQNLSLFICETEIQ